MHMGMINHKDKKRALDPLEKETGGCELPDMNAGNQTQGFCKNKRS